MRWGWCVIVMVAVASPTVIEGQDTRADSLKAAFWKHARAGAMAGDSCLSGVAPEVELLESVRCPVLHREFRRAQEPARLLRDCCPGKAFVTRDGIPIEEAAASLLDLSTIFSDAMQAGHTPPLEEHMLLLANLRHIWIEAGLALRPRR